MKHALIGSYVVATLLSGPPELSLIEDFASHSDALPDLSYNVLRLDMDVTGDGTPEVLLAHSGSQGTGGIQEWFVYEKTSEGRYRRLDVVGFSYLTFKVTGQGSSMRVLAYYRGQEHGTGAIATYRVDAGGFSEESRVEHVVAGGEEWRSFEVWRRERGVKVFSSDLEAIRRNRAAWKDVLSNAVGHPVPDLAEVYVPQ